MEEFSLFYIRTHYISFIRLYNKSLKLADNLSKSQIAINNAAITLSKLHLKCLFVIAQNRNQETSRNFLKLRIVDFLTREIELEYDVFAYNN